jgi:Ca2+-transporting ATPase
MGLGVLAGVFALCAWAVAAGRSPGEVAALGFAAIVAGNLAMILASRAGRGSLFAALARPNPALWWVLAGALAALAAVLYLPSAAAVFRFAPPGAGDLALALAAGASGVLWYEAVKAARRR